MQFGNPIALWSLAFLPVLALIGWAAQRRRDRTREKIGQASLVAQLFPGSVRSWRWKRFWIGLAIFGLVGFSAARPQYGRVEQTISRVGVDVLIAIDVSPSMLATDVAPNRLAKAKESLRRLVRRMRGNRVGIVAFAGEAFLLCPMTLDHTLASLVLESVDEETVGVAGTDLGRAIEVAQGAFERGAIGSPVLVLLTDGEDNEGHGLRAAEKAAKAGIEIHAIAIGTERGAPVPDGERGYKEMARGGKVVSRLDLAGLGAIARATGGLIYHAGDNPNIAVNSIALRIDRMEKQEIESTKQILFQDRYGWFLAPVMFLLPWFLMTRPSQPRPIALRPAQEGA